MDFKQLEYILMIDREKNISHAAEKLYISQSALNQQLLKLEKELGCRLFHRSRTDWHTTPAGEIYLDGARKALQLKKDTYTRINDLVHSNTSTLRIGLPPGRGFKMFLEIYPQLRAQYPDLVVRPIEMGVRHQQRAIANGEIDLGFVTLADEERTSDHYIEVGREEMAAMIPRVLPQARGYPVASFDEDLPMLDLKLLENEPFAVMFHESTTRTIQDRIFANAGFDPHIILETSSTRSQRAMVELGLCCCIMPRYYTIDADISKVAAFVLPGHPFWKLCLSYKRDSYLSDAAHTFIALATEYWDQRLIPPQGA